MNQVDITKEYPYCDFFKYHEETFNMGVCPCGDSFIFDNELRCNRTNEKIKELRSNGYYFKCQYMRRENK